MNNLKVSIAGMGIAVAVLSACSSGSQQELTASGLNPAAFDSTINGKKTALYTLKNNSGMRCALPTSVAA